MNEMPGPGIYTDMGDDEYFTLPYASKSQLWRIESMPPAIRTVEQARGYLEFDAPTYDMMLGRAFDDAMSGNNWPDGYAPGPNKTPTSKAWTQAQAETDAVLLKPEDIDTVGRWANTMRADPIVSEMLASPKLRYQVVVIWDDELTEARCKAKIDFTTVYNGVRSHGDFKTWTKKRKSCPSDIAFGWEISDRGYDVQAAHYLDGCAHYDRFMGRPVQHRKFYIAAIEKGGIHIPGTGETVYEVGVYDMDDHDLDAAIRVRDALLNKWITIMDGTWRPAPQEVKRARLGRYYEDKHSNERESI